MKASHWEFRYRFWIILAIYVLGFTTPWDAVLHIDPQGINGDVWGWLAMQLSRSGALTISAAFNLVLAAAIACAVVGAALRIWGTASLGADVMSDRQMRGDAVVATGPYRYMRNPLYVGSWGNTLALALLMRPSGALFTIVGIVGFHLWLIFAEESFLTEKLGDTYRAYCAAVPRLVPSLRPRVPEPTRDDKAVTDGAPNVGARWGRAFLVEIYMWMSALGFAALGWRYDKVLLLKVVLVSLGVSLVVKGLMGRS